MAGASRNHNLIVGNLVGELWAHLRDRDCRVYPSDLRVRVEKTGLHTYPDVIVTCDKEKIGKQALSPVGDIISTQLWDDWPTNWSALRRQIVGRSHDYHRLPGQNS